MKLTLLAAMCLLAACGAATIPTALQRVEVLDEFCGAEAGKCNHLASRIVDFDAGVLERHTCAEGVDGGSPKWGPQRGDVIDRHAVTASQLEQVRAAVARLQISSQRIEAFDGAMTSVLITTASKGTPSSGPWSTASEV